jgi:hypothetical protein
MKKIVLSVLLVGSTVLAMAANKESKSENTPTTSAQVTQLYGEVIDKNTNESLVGVKVTLDGTDKVAYTDFDGKYSFNDLKQGTYKLTASYISYENSTVENIVLTPKANEVDFSLKNSN